jgi:hypothetical protein
MNGRLDGRLVRSGVALLAMACLPASGASQTVRWETEINGSRVRIDSLASLNSPSLATSLELRGGALLARFGGSVTSFQDNGESLQGRAEVAGWFSPAGAGSPLRLEVGAGVGGSTHSQGFDTFVAQGDLRLYLQASRAGVWAGMTAATSENSFDASALGSTAPNVGAWVQAGPARLVVRYTDQRVDGERFPETSLAAVLSRGAVDFSAFAGYRSSPFDGVDADTWAGASAAVWVRSNLALLISGGRYAPDVVQGIPGGEFFSVGLRIAPQRRRALVPTAPLPLVLTPEAARRGVGFRVPEAVTVEVAGDWNGWQPVPLDRGPDGRWMLPAALEPGVYRFNLRVDGVTWIVPEEVPSVEDGFGGLVGLLLISEG